MVYERVHKSSGQSSSLKKQSPIVPPLIEQQTQADSQLSPKAMPSIMPSIEEKDAINPQLFGDLTKINETLARTRTSPQSTSNSSHKGKIALPSKEKRDAIYRQLFGNCTETDDVQSKTPESSSVAGAPIQAKLTIGAPGDKYEQEADKVAAQVVNQINVPVAQQPNQNLQREDMSQEDELMMKSETSNIQREAIPEEEEELQMKPTLQLQSGVGGMAATTELESSIQQARSGGQPLADNVRQPMEQAFGADFRGVKLHTDTQADQLNQSIQARAFTTGQDVFFRSGEYSPGNRGGQELLAHELTHVVQQGGGVVLRKQQPQHRVRQKPNAKIASPIAGDGVIQKMSVRGTHTASSLSTATQNKHVQPVAKQQAEADAGFGSRTFVAQDSDITSVVDANANDFVEQTRTASKRFDFQAQVPIYQYMKTPPDLGAGKQATQTINGISTLCEIGVVKKGDDTIQVTHFKMF